MLFDELRCFNSVMYKLRALNVEVCDQNIAALILLTFSFKSSWHIIVILRSSRPEVFCNKGILKHFTKVIGKQLSRSLFFHKIAG